MPVTCSDIFGVWGSTWLGGLRLPQPYAGKVASLRQLIGWLSAEIGLLDTVIADLLSRHDGYHAIRRLPGIGPVLAAVIAEAQPGGAGEPADVADLGDLKVARGHITKMGSPILRWALVEAIQHQPDGSPVRDIKDRIIARRGNQAKNIAKAAAARKLLTCVFYAMRDGTSGHWPPAATQRRRREQARTRAAHDRPQVWPPPPAAPPCL